MTRAKWIASASLIVAAATAAALLSSGAFGSNTSTQSPTDVTVAGAVTPTPSMRAVLERTQTADGVLARVGISHDATFYRITGAKKRGDCFAVGYGRATSATINLIACGETPATQRPVVDSSVFETVNGTTTFDQLIGWSTPNVRLLTLFDSDGTSLVSVTPEGGFYYLPRHLMPKNGVRLDALNGAGKVVWSYDATS
jgi:hypothetical protein